MEDAAQALKMAFGVFIFVIALSISMAAFSQVRATAQSVINIKDRETEFEAVEMSGTKRLVGEETIIPSLYRSYKEDYVVIFEGIGPVWQVWNEDDSAFKSTNIIDLKEQRVENHQKAVKLIDNLLTGTDFKDSYYKHYFEGGLFNKIKAVGIFEETQGIYYNLDVGTNEENNPTDTPDVNKAEKRVITYTKVN